MQKFLTSHIRSSLILFVASVLLAYAFVSFYVTPKYQATAVIFPPNAHANIHLIGGGMRFGYDKEIGEQLEILNSTAVRNAMIKEFDLQRRYKVDSNSKYFTDRLNKTYDRNVNTDRTLNKSIQIVVQDEDAGVAASMANRLVVLADKHLSEIVLRNVKQAAEAAYESYQDKAKTIALMTDSLEALRQAGESVWTFGEERKSGKYQNYELQYRRELDRFLELKMRWEELDDLLNESVPKSYVVSPAIVSQKPVSPKKGRLSVLAGILTVLVFLSFKKLKTS